MNAGLPAQSGRRDLREADAMPAIMRLDGVSKEDSR